MVSFSSTSERLHRSQMSLRGSTERDRERRCADSARLAQVMARLTPDAQEVGLRSLFY